MFHTVDHLDDVQFEQLMRFYEKCWWTGGRTAEHTKLAIQSSTFMVGITDDRGTLAGFARVLSDGQFKALILDVVVDELYRGKGLGDLLMETILAHPMVCSVRHAELYCREEMEPYYNRFRFETVERPILFMRRQNTGGGSRQAEEKQ